MCVYVWHSLRLQAYICLKLYNVKKSEVHHLRKAIDENFQVFCANYHFLSISNCRHIFICYNRFTDSELNCMYSFYLSAILFLRYWYSKSILDYLTLLIHQTSVLQHVYLN